MHVVSSMAPCSCSIHASHWSTRVAWAAASNRGGRLGLHLACHWPRCASAWLVLVAALLEAAVADHERSTGPWEIEWIALPEIFLLAAGALAQTRELVAGLQVDADRMRANLDLTHGAIVSEAVMMGLAPHLGRQRAHDLVYDICRDAAVSGKALVDLLAKDKEISRHVK